MSNLASPAAPTRKSPVKPAMNNSSKPPSPAPRRVSTPGRAKGSNRLSHYLKTPLRVLTGARDLYVNSFTMCAGRTRYGASRGGARQGTSGVPRGFSFRSASTSREEDIRDLIRAASRRSGAFTPKGGLSPAASVKEAALPKSQSVACGRIDEDQPMEFDGNDGMMGMDYPRSRSCAVVMSNRRIGVAS